MSRWERLLIVQQHDTHADQLLYRSQTLPVRAELAKLEDDLADLDRKIAAVDDRLVKLRRSQQRLEDEIASWREKMGASDKLLYSGTIGNPRELQALHDEIESIKRHVAKLEDDELDVMEATEPVDAERAGLAAEREGRSSEAEQARAELATAEAAIDAELASVYEDRAAAAAEVPDDLWDEYDGLQARLGGVAIARLAGSTCQGCHLALSAVEIDRIRRLPLDERVYCEECGRLLVRP
jgi:predicted  nucleic acid-binding Zn-ribbon protein